MSICVLLTFPGNSNFHPDGRIIARFSGSSLGCVRRVPSGSRNGFRIFRIARAIPGASWNSINSRRRPVRFRRLSPYSSGIRDYSKWRLEFPRSDPSYLTCSLLYAFILRILCSRYALCREYMPISPLLFELICKLSTALPVFFCLFCSFESKRTELRKVKITFFSFDTFGPFRALKRRKKCQKRKLSSC